MFEIYQDVFAVGAKCVRATYTDQGETVGVKNEYVSPLTGYGSIEGSARFASSASVGELIVNFNNPAGRSLFVGADPNAPNYSVIDTDYTSYSVVYMCRPIAGIFKKGAEAKTQSSPFLKHLSFLNQNLCGSLQGMRCPLTQRLRQLWSKLTEKSKKDGALNLSNV